MVNIILVLCPIRLLIAPSIYLRMFKMVPCIRKSALLGIILHGERFFHSAFEIFASTCKKGGVLLKIYPQL